MRENEKARRFNKLQQKQHSPTSRDRAMERDFKFLPLLYNTC